MIEQFNKCRPDLGKISPAHRLDKPVSGVLLLTRNAAAAEAMRGKITDRDVSKGYVARVEGMSSVLLHCACFGLNNRLIVYSRTTKRCGSLTCFLGVPGMLISTLTTVTLIEGLQMLLDNGFFGTDTFYAYQKETLVDGNVQAHFLTNP
jgi:RNA pseudouridylate synthase